MARESAPVTLGQVPLTYKSITLNVDDQRLGELLKSRRVRLSAVCLDPVGKIEVLIENPNPVRGSRGTDSVEIEADSQTLIGMVSPTMKVVFRGETYSAEFDTMGISGRPLFSAAGPLQEGIRKD